MERKRYSVEQRVVTVKGHEGRAAEGRTTQGPDLQCARQLTYNKTRYARPGGTKDRNGPRRDCGHQRRPDQGMNPAPDTQNQET